MPLPKPNLVLPLAISYNERGVDGFATTVTSGKDQRKINSMYEPIKNALTGKTTLYLTKRPGVILSATTLGSGGTSYLIALRPDVSDVSAITAADYVLYAKSGNNINANANTIVAEAANYPAYTDTTLISGVRTAVLQTVVNSGSGAGKGGTAWFASDISSWTQITDSDYTGLTVVGKMEHMDGYGFIASRPDSRIYNSDLNSLASWNPVNYITKQIVQDVNQGLARLGKMIIAFGLETMEVYRNAGNPSGSPLAVVPELFHKTGMKVTKGSGATNYCATVGGRLYWVGASNSYNGFLGAYAFDGGKVEKISTPAIDKILAAVADSSGDVYAINSVTVNGQDAVAFLIDPPGTATMRWLMFFPAWNDWFEWNSTVFSPVNCGRYFLGTGNGAGNDIYTYFGTNGLALTGQWLDNATAYTMTHQFKIPHESDVRQHMKMCGVTGDTATAASSLGVSFSDDDDVNFSTARNIDMTRNNSKTLNRCGTYYDRTVRLTHSGNVECRLRNFVARIE